MLDFDFAFFNMQENNRGGLANRKSFLDWLAPVFYSPRVKQLIHFGRLGLKGCNVRLPLGEGNWTILNPNNRGLMIEKTEAILKDYEIPRMGVDRRLKSLFLSQQHNLPVVFGDHFISALAAILIEKAIASQDIKKLVLVGDIPDLFPLLNNISRYHIPVSVQNYHPVANETTFYRLLYDKGLAVSNSFIKPQNWGPGDLIVSFEPGSRSLAVASPEVFAIRLDDDSSGLAPELEQVLIRAGLNPKMNTLAPILETCLLRKEGKLNSDEEDGQQELIAVGDDIGLWEPFLDNGV
ncbi:MAG: hypothetical protein PHF24_02295 [Syntrophomonas sp.]|nr:hypothetical protein [Syntrophomonas sp.]